jgi:glycosyltransferase involved in cell wall biosynthesis
MSEEIAERIADARFTAELGVARSDYALEMAANTPLLLRMLALRSWLELRPLGSGPRISVVLATRDRPALLPRAIESVLAQRYPEWELLIVDDGETDSVAQALATREDERIVVVESPRCGLGAARNAGLDRASGAVVCYLDDDNVLHPEWLHAVAHLFAARADVDVAYGVAVTEHQVAGERDEGWWPAHWQLPFSRETLLERNITDVGAIAHRRELAEARFDEELRTGEDWDLLLRLTGEREAVAIPAVSHAYAMEGDGRMTEDPEHRAGLERIRRRHAGG